MCHRRFLVQHKQMPYSMSTRAGTGWPGLLAASLFVLVGFAALRLGPGSELPSNVVDSVLAGHAPVEPAAPFVDGPRLAEAPTLVGLSSNASLDGALLGTAERSVSGALRRGEFPGAALAVGRGDRLGLLSGLGHIARGAGADPVDAERTVYDLASLTKVVALTTAVMLLVEDGSMELDAPVRRYLPSFSGGAKDRVTVRQLLTHTSGLPAGAGLWGTPAEALERTIALPLKHAPGQTVEYSDVGPVVLWAAAERTAGEPLWWMLERRVFGPLKMRSTTFLPGEPCSRCAPSERRRDGTVIRGMVHDPMARRLGGIAGNAGLFSTAHDLARFAAMMAGEGELDGVRVLQAETIRQFTRRQPGAGTRALGWDTPTGNGTGPAGVRMSPRAYGHTGFTGTSLWIDPERGTWVVLLANRTFEPAGPNRMQAIRRSVHDEVARSADRFGPISAE
jgi:CubicO group peptidase (beta-lactamase class C family)